MRRAVVSKWVCLVVLVFAGRAGAQPYVTFNNLGPNGTYSNSGSWFGYNPFGDWGTPAISFVPSVEGTLSSLTAAMAQWSPSDRFTFSLRADDGNKPGQTVLWQKTFDDMLPFPNTALVTFPVDNGPYVRFGERYWLLATVPNTTTYHGWSHGLTGNDTWALMGNFTGGEWWILNGNGPSLRAEVIPEPAGCLLTIALAAGSLRRCRSGRRSERVCHGR